MGEVIAYKTIATAVEGEFTERGSRFLGYAYPINSKAEFDTHLQHLKSEHFKARHHCYAYRLRPDGSDYRANDDGEPSGTGGKPILGRIDSYQITNVGLIVVRYFGGTLLGTGGLIQAYRQAAESCFEKAEIIEKQVMQALEITCNIDTYHILMKNLKGWGGRVSSRTFGDMLIINIEMPVRYIPILKTFQTNNPNFVVKFIK